MIAMLITFSLSKRLRRRYVVALGEIKRGDDVSPPFIAV